jgi:hypothetical protein
MSQIRSDWHRVKALYEVCLERMPQERTRLLEEEGIVVTDPQCPQHGYPANLPQTRPKPQPRTR